MRCEFRKKFLFIACEFDTLARLAKRMIRTSEGRNFFASGREAFPNERSTVLLKTEKKSHGHDPLAFLARAIQSPRRECCPGPGGMATDFTNRSRSAPEFESGVV